MHGAPLRALHARVRALLPNYKCSILMSNYDLLILALYIFIELHFTSVLKNVKKLTVLGQYPAILTSGLVNDAYIFCSCQLNHFYIWLTWSKHSGCGWVQWLHGTILHSHEMVMCSSRSFLVVFTWQLAFGQGTSLKEQDNKWSWWNQCRKALKKISSTRSCATKCIRIQTEETATKLSETLK